MAGAGDRAYNTVSSGESQTEFQRVALQLETLLDMRTKQVNAAMAHYQATGVSAQYAGVEGKWKAAAQEVRDIIKLLKQSLVQNDEAAFTALKRAGTAVNNIV